MTHDDDRQEKTSGKDERREEEQQQDQGKVDGEGAGPAEDLQEDPAYNPQGPERGYKGG